MEASDTTAEPNAQALAQACADSMWRNDRARPVHTGEALTAHAVERSKAGRGGIYDVTVSDSTSVVIAEFRGHSRTIAGDLRAPISDKAS